ncbi:hypothetical protein [Acidihalobacter prosperus]|uniref:hypothetical protein n=1 Tax=Acidihalobacter prosperus TaxID=160660 RepID=UPI0014722D7F
MPYFYPLDGILEWNRMYGRKGFFQYQCVLPPAASAEGVQDLLEIIARHKTGSFLAVLKTFGHSPAPGMLSFPRPGATLALDFPNQGRSTLRLLDELDAVVRACRATCSVLPIPPGRSSAPSSIRSSRRVSGGGAWSDYATYRDFWGHLCHRRGSERARTA